MIIELLKNNIEKIDNTFIDNNMIINEIENNPFAKILILEEDNNIIGYLYYSDIYDRIEINQFEIKKEYRNRGKGKYLLQYLLDNEKKDNYSAIKVYESKGFETKAVRKGYYNGIDGLLMERKYKDSSR